MIISKNEFLKIIDRLERYDECQNKIQDLFNDLIDNIENDFFNAGSICIGHESVVVKLLETMFETDLISWWLYEMEYGRKVESDSLIDKNDVGIDVTTPEKLYDYLVQELERKKTMEKEYRYMIWNDLKKEYQFANICETTEKGAIKCLFNTIGNDARKDRFVVKKIEKEIATEIRRKLKYKAIAKKIHREIPNTNYELIYDLVIKNYEGMGEIENDKDR